MSGPTDLERELIDWAQRHGYDPTLDAPDDPLNEVDYSRLLEGERQPTQIEAERFGRGPAYSADHDPGNACENCCGDLLVMVVQRTTKHYIGKGWQAVSGSFNLDLWLGGDERGKVPVMSGYVIEPGGEIENLIPNSKKRIPPGTYGISRVQNYRDGNYKRDESGKIVIKNKIPQTNLHATYGEEVEPPTSKARPHIAMAVRTYSPGKNPNGGAEGRGIDIHRGTSRRATDGCLLLGTNLGDDAGLPTFTLADTDSTMRTFIEHIHKFKGKTYNRNSPSKSNKFDNKVLTCVKLIVKDAYAES